MNWTLAPSLRVYIDQINREYPKRSKLSDGTIGDAAHQRLGFQSDHNPNVQGVVTAFDLTHDPQNGVDIQREADRLVRSKDPRIKYVIANKRIWEPGIGWKSYAGTNPHTKHMHLSVKSSNASVQTPWRLKEEDMKLSTAAEVNLIWQANGVNRAPNEKEVREALGRTLENYLEYFLQLPFVKANLAKVKFYDKDLEKFNEINKILKG